MNIKELESYLAAEEACCTSVWESSRTISLLDSQVCVGTLLKGRSSSFSLNSRTRTSLPCLLFFNLHPHTAYIASEDNAADDPTRQRPVRPPVMPEPLWLRLAEDGDFSELDRFLLERQLEPLQLQGIPELLARFHARSGRPAFPPGLMLPSGVRSFCTSAPAFRLCLICCKFHSFARAWQLAFSCCLPLSA